SSAALPGGDSSSPPLGCTKPSTRSPARASSSMARYRGSKMVSGSATRGSTMARRSGNIGRQRGRSAGRRYRCDRFGKAHPLATRSGKEDGRQPPPALEGQWILRSPGVEQLHQLLTCSLFVPFAIATNHFQQLIERFGLLALGGERR